MRKLTLPALAACALLAASAPVATAKPVKAHAASLGSKLSQVSGALKGVQKAVNQIKDVNSGQTAAINGVDGRVTTVVANLTSLSNKVDAIVAVATDSLTKLQAGLVSLAQGTAAAAGSGDPNNSATTTTATSTVPAVPTSSLSAGTLYRQIVLATGGALNTAPIGARTWVRMPDVAAVGYSNTWVCTSAGTAPQASNVGGTGHGYDLTCSGGAAAFGH
jgi:hypothetical protein